MFWYVSCTNSQVEVNFTVDLTSMLMLVAEPLTERDRASHSCKGLTILQKVGQHWLRIESRLPLAFAPGMPRQCLYPAVCTVISSWQLCRCTIWRCRHPPSLEEYSTVLPVLHNIYHIVSLNVFNVVFIRFGFQTSPRCTEIKLKGFRFHCKPACSSAVMFLIVSQSS